MTLAKYVRNALIDFGFFALLLVMWIVGGKARCYDSAGKRIPSGDIPVRGLIKMMLGQLREH